MSGLIGGSYADPPAQVWGLINTLVDSLNTYVLYGSGDGRAAEVTSSGSGAGGLNHPGAWVLIQDTAGLNGLMFRRSERGSDKWTVAAFVDTLPDLTQASPSRSPSTASASTITDDAHPLFLPGSHRGIIFADEDTPYGFVYAAVDSKIHRATTSIVWDPGNSHSLTAQRILSEPNVDVTRYRKVYPGGRRQVPRMIAS